MNNKRKRQEEYIDPIDFNPSLYPVHHTHHTRSSRNNPVDDIIDHSHHSVHVAKRNCHSLNSNIHSTSAYNMHRRKNRSSHSDYNSASNVDSAAIEAMFNDIAEEDDPTIATMEGICTIAEKLNIDPLEDIRILVLLHKMGANEKPGQISRDEFKKGCQKLQTDSIAKLQALLPSLDTGFMVDSEFRDFYKFCFQFNRQGTHKTLEKDLVVGLIEMTLKGRIAEERLGSFVQFLNETKDTSYNRVTLDQWLSFYDFSKECTDLSQYDEENSAWPVLIDDFVDFALNSMQM